MLHVAGTRRVQDSASAEEQQALEDRVIEDMEQRGCQCQRRGPGHSVCLEGERQSQADEDDTDVFDSVIGEQALQIVLHQRIEHAERRSNPPKHQHHHAPPPGRRAKKIEDDADEAVDRDLGHHATH